VIEAGQEREQACTLREDQAVVGRQMPNRLLRLLSHRLALPLLLLALLLYYLPGIRPALATSHDDGTYVVTARALAEGHAYRIESLPGAPLQTKYPPLYPELLAVLWKLSPQFPANLLLFHLATIGLWLAALALTYRLLVRFGYASPPVAWLVVALWGLAFNSARYTSALRSEPLFTLLMVGSLWYAERTLEARPDRSALRFAALSGLLAGLAFLTRTTGIALLVGLLYALFRPQRRVLPALCAGALPCVAGWTLWSRLHPRLAPWDLRTYYLDYAAWTARQLAQIPLPTVVMANLTKLATSALPGPAIHLLNQVTVGQWAQSRLAIVIWLLGLATTGLIIWGGLALWRAGRPLLPCVVLLTALPLCLYPFDVERFLVPIGGLSVLLLVEGWRRLQRALGRGALALSVLTGLILLLGLTRDLRYLRDTLRPSYDPQEAAIAWTRAHVAPGEAVYSLIDPWIYLYTGRQGISDHAWIGLEGSGLAVHWKYRADYCPAADRQREQLRQMNVRWILDMGDLQEPREYPPPGILATHPQWFDLVYSAGSGRLHVYRLHDAGSLTPNLPSPRIGDR